MPWVFSYLPYTPNWGPEGPGSTKKHRQLKPKTNNKACFLWPKGQEKESEKKKKSWGALNPAPQLGPLRTIQPTSGSWGLSLSPLQSWAPAAVWSACSSCNSKAPDLLKPCLSAGPPVGHLISLEQCQRSPRISQTPLHNGAISGQSHPPTKGTAVTSWDVPDPTAPSRHWSSIVSLPFHQWHNQAQGPVPHPKKVTQWEQANCGSTFFPCRWHQQGLSRKLSNTRKTKQTRITLQGLRKLNCHWN